jgi:hypothetical protein
MSINKANETGAEQQEIGKPILLVVCATTMDATSILSNNGCT